MPKYHIVAEISGIQKPRILIEKNNKNKIIFRLLDWNSMELDHGLESKDIEELISTLRIGLEKSKYINIDDNTELLFDSTWDV